MMNMEKIDEMIDLLTESLNNEINDTGTAEADKIKALTELIKVRAEIVI